jgi:hypothetical protein
VGDAGARRVRAQRRAGGRAAGPAGAARACAALDRDAGSARRVDRVVDPGRGRIPRSTRSSAPRHLWGWPCRRRSRAAAMRPAGTGALR